jgi:hypothetical protein
MRYVGMVVLAVGVVILVAGFLLFVAGDNGDAKALAHVAGTVIMGLGGLFCAFAAAILTHWQ